MGYVRKKTGVQGQIDATRANAEAQIEATREAAKRSQQALMQSAKDAASQQAMIAARAAAESRASDAASMPLQTAEVQLDEDQTQSAAATRRQRRATFGRNYGTGVQI